MKMFLTLYLIIGFIYAIYSFVVNKEGILSIPINTIAFPAMFVKALIDGIKGYIREKHIILRGFSYKKLFETKKLVLFDLDGTLVQTHPIYVEAFLNVFKAHGYDVEEETIVEHIEDLLGSGLDTTQHVKALIKYLKELEGAKDLDQETITKEVREEYLKILPEYEIEVLEGFWDFVFTLKETYKIKVGLVTNTPREQAQATMKEASLDELFDVEIFGDMAKRKKPAPDLYKMALKEAGVTAKECIAFEDSVVGIEASLKAGIDTIVVWDGETPRAKYPATVGGYITDFQEINSKILISEEDAKKMLDDLKNQVMNKEVETVS